MEIFESVLFYLAVLLRFLGMVVLGLGVGWFTLDAFRKANWQLQIAIFLGFLGMAIAMVVYLSIGAQAAYALGAGIALLVWGLGKSGKKDEAEEEKKK